MTCTAERKRKQCAANPEKGREYSRKRRAEHPEKVCESNRAYREASSERLREYSRKRRAEHPEKVREQERASGKAHPGATRARSAKRRAMKLAQRCACCTDAQIAEFHKQAALCGRGAEVDHIVQLSFGGPHCAKNLVALTLEDHKIKTKLDAAARAESRRRNKLLKAWAHAARVPVIQKQPTVASTAPLWERAIWNGNHKRPESDAGERFVAQAGRQAAASALALALAPAPGSREPVGARRATTARGLLAT